MHLLIQVSFGSVILTLLEFIFVMNTETIVGCLAKSACFRSILDDGTSSSEICLSDGRRRVVGSVRKRLYVTSRTNYIHNPLNTRQRHHLHHNECVLNENGVEETDGDGGASSADRLAESIEGVARIMFPLSYAVFLLCYFAYFMDDHH